MIRRDTERAAQRDIAINVGLVDLGVNVGGKEQVATAALLDDLGKARLVDGQIIAVPGIDLLLGQVNDADSDLFICFIIYIEGNEAFVR